MPETTIAIAKMRVETVSEARMIDIVAEGYDAGVRNNQYNDIRCLSTTSTH
jgi:hypothetical protein